jgi:dihydroorotate dehydrogenase
MASTPVFVKIAPDLDEEQVGHCGSWSATAWMA